MADTTTVVPASADNTTTTTPPASADNGVEAERVAELEAKVSKQAEMLAASKAEALRLKEEKEALVASQAQAEPDNDVEYFKQLAKKAGVPSQEDFRQVIYKKEQDESLEKFLAEYPDYLPENDKDNKRWNSLIQEASYFRTPNSGKEWHALLKKAHKSINPDSFEKARSVGRAEATLKDQATVGSGGSASSPKKKLSPDQQAIQDGFKAARPDYYKD